MNRSLTTAVDNPAFAEIVRRQLHGDAIPGENANVVLAHLPGNMCGHDVSVFEFNPERRIGKRLCDDALHLYGIFFGQNFSVSVKRLANCAEMAALMQCGASLD